MLRVLFSYWNFLQEECGLAEHALAPLIRKHQSPSPSLHHVDIPPLRVDTHLHLSLTQRRIGPNISEFDIHGGAICRGKIHRPFGLSRRRIDDAILVTKRPFHASNVHLVSFFLFGIGVNCIPHIGFMQIFTLFPSNIHF